MHKATDITELASWPLTHECDDTCPPGRPSSNRPTVGSHISEGGREGRKKWAAAAFFLNDMMDESAKR